MAKKPFFSIIIPALNEARYLPKLLKDLSNQTFLDFEVIVVDGGSRDKTVELANSFSSKLPQFSVYTSSRAHVCTQRNLGAKHASADILIFSDADNRLPPYFLQGIKYRHESSLTDIASTWIRPDIPTPSSELICVSINMGLELQNRIKPTFFLESLIIISTKAFKKIGGFNDQIDFAEGQDLLEKMSKHNLKLKTYRDPIYRYSFRRFRKFGTLQTIKNTTQLGITKLLGPEYNNLKAKQLYPMLGGTIFNRPPRAKNKFINNIQKLLKDF